MKKIIVLDRYKDGDLAVRACFWLVVPAARQVFYADATKTSEFKNATAQEVQDIKDGKVYEVVESHSVSGLNITIVEVRAKLIARYNALQASVTSENPWQNYGTSWDGTSWTPAGVA